jgi:hypothetical protein
MKVTSNWVLKHFPFLSDLLKQGKIEGRQKLILVIKVGPVEIKPPYHEAVSRFTSMGKIGGASFTHFAGSDASIMNNPQELLAGESPMEGRIVNPQCYYAILDIIPSYGFRELTMYFNSEDLKKASIELKNQLTELHLQLTISPP